MESIWSKEYKIESSQKELNGDIKTDVLIIGGGMAGVLCAYKLKQKGMDCILVEQGKIGGANTQNTTAKITAQHNLIYNSVVKKYGLEKGKMYYDINIAAIEEYKKMAEGIDCDFEEKTAYVYSKNNKNKLEQELRAYDALRIHYVLQAKTPLPFPVCEAIGLPGQAQFHPLKFINGILPKIQYYENTMITEMDDNRAITQNASIKAKSIIMATHYPMVNIPGFYFVKLTQSRSYALALKRGAEVDGMYIDEEKNGYSFRNYNDLLLLGGGGHKTGKKGGGWNELRQFAKDNYPDSREEIAWSAQDCMSLDHIPYIGIHHKSKPGLYIASGFNKWGMTGSMAAAMVLTDLIVSGKSEYQELFSPQRSIWHPTLFTNVANAAINLIRPGKRCTHMGCCLQHNKEENSWDCPCHGSRFSQDGRVLDNPAKKGKKVEL